METTVINTHKVEDFGKWKVGFEAGKSMRDQAGIKIKGVYQSIDDENTVTVISEFPNPAIAKSFIESMATSESFAKSGVISKPEIKILSQTF
ncbi:MAG: hypothetical protein V4622_04060 [Bacteroidota bacterium]